MRALTAAAVLCVLSACSTTPRPAAVTENTTPAPAVDALQAARASNRHWLAPNLIESFPAAVAPDYRPPERLAVLLPQTGPLAVAGNAIRDGLLAAYYAEPRRKPGIRFYDSKGSAEGIKSALQEALADGAQMVIGGIGKEEVAVLAATELRVPVLALNRIETPRNRMLLNFSLSPEREGELMAERLLQKKWLLAGIFRQSSESNARAIAAFEKRYGQGGGRVIWMANVPPFSASETGERSVPALPETMREAQALVLWLPADSAKSLRAALALSGMSAVPLLASSGMADGRDNKPAQELNGIEFLQMPWLAAMANNQNLQAVQLLKLPSARGAGAALNAFGVDAWLIATRLPVWLESPKTEIAGATGALHMDPDGRIEHRMLWRIYRDGTVQAASD
jgi:uncharacterized protein